MDARLREQVVSRRLNSHIFFCSTETSTISGRRFIALCVVKFCFVINGHKMFRIRRRVFMLWDILIQTFLINALRIYLLKLFSADTICVIFHSHT
jgi:hypothetical protein